MDQEERFVDFFYDKYPGRVSLGVGYGHGLKEIFPFVFVDDDDVSIGIIALDSLMGDIQVVHIYHIGSFVHKQGDGSRMMDALCRVADDYQVTLSLSPVYLDNGKDTTMGDDDMIGWYRRFGFEGEGQLLRTPAT